MKTPTKLFLASFVSIILCAVLSESFDNNALKLVAAWFGLASVVLGVAGILRVLDVWEA